VAPKEIPAGSELPENNNFPSYQEKEDKVSLDPFDYTLLGKGIPNYVLDPSLKMDLGPLASTEELKALSDFYNLEKTIDNEPWIQTYSGRRFNPLNPNINAIVIQDIAHSLSMLCRFTGHVSSFYSVAQHSVLVSYLCDEADKLHGLLHDASEAYCQDIPSPLKKCPEFAAYREVENKMQLAICRRFGLSETEPTSVKKADKVLLATEARDLMAPLHPDWAFPAEPLPFKIEAWDQQKAKNMFVKRFFELTGASETNYQHYLRNNK